MGGGTTETDLINLRHRVTSCTQTDQGQGSEDAQRRKEHIFTPLIIIQLSEQIEAKLCICCSKGGHCGMECRLEDKEKWNEFQVCFRRI